MARIIPSSAASINQAVNLLHQGRLVAFPTETVYGLGADATNGKAVAAIYAAKQRPEINPLIIHVPASASLDGLIEWNDVARRLAQNFWPGPLTLVLPRKKTCPVSLLASAGLETLAVRVPSHPVAQQLLKSFGKPIAAPSANLSGKLSPTAPEHVAESLGDKVGLILSGEKPSVGLESTVVDCTGSHPLILRPGGVTREQLAKILGKIAEAPAPSDDQKIGLSSPGQLASHYAPHLPLRMNANAVGADEALLVFGSGTMIKGDALRLNLSPTGDLAEAAANLFAMLRQLDRPHLKGIAVMPIPDEGLGVAINDRLRRACIR